MSFIHDKIQNILKSIHLYMSKTMPESICPRVCPQHIAGSANLISLAIAMHLAVLHFKLTKSGLSFSFISRENGMFACGCFVWRRKYMFQVKCHAMISSDT